MKDVDKMTGDQVRRELLDTVDSTRALIKQMPPKEQAEAYKKLLDLLHDAVYSNSRRASYGGFINIPNHDGRIF